MSHLSVDDIPHRVETILIDFVFEISFKSSPSEWMWIQERNSIMGCRKEHFRIAFLKENLVGEAALKEVSHVIVIRPPRAKKKLKFGNISFDFSSRLTSPG